MAAAVPTTNVVPATGDDNKPRAERNQSYSVEVSTRSKWSFAAAFLGAWGPLSVWNTWRTTLFVIYFQANLVAMGAIQTAAAIVDVLNGPLVAQLADSIPAAVLTSCRCA